MDRKIFAADLIDICRSDQNKHAFRSQTSQMIALSALAIFYADRIKWHPVENISNKTRRELQDFSLLANIDLVDHRTFIIHVRRMVHKLCNSKIEQGEILRIREAANGVDALKQLLDYLLKKNIFTANHIRIWAMMDDFRPLDLTRKTGDASRFRKEYCK